MFDVVAGAVAANAVHVAVVSCIAVLFTCMLLLLMCCMGCILKRKAKKNKKNNTEI